MNGNNNCQVEGYKKRHDILPSDKIKNTAEDIISCSVLLFYIINSS